VVERSQAAAMLASKTELAYNCLNGAGMVPVTPSGSAAAGRWTRPEPVIARQLSVLRAGKNGLA